MSIESAREKYQKAESAWALATLTDFRNADAADLTHARRVAFDALIDEAQAAMPCYLYDPNKPNNGYEFMKDCGCPSHQARGRLTVKEAVVDPR